MSSCGFDNRKQMGGGLMPLVFVEIKTIKRGPGICHHLEGRTADVAREERWRHQAVLLTAALSNACKDEARARASGRLLRAISAEMMGPLNRGVLHTFCAPAAMNANMHDSNYHSE